MGKTLRPLGLILAFGALLLTFPAQAAAAAREGLVICFQLIIPALFPFFVLSSLLVSLGFAALLGRVFQGVMRPLFGLSGPCATALFLGAIGGYPVGIRSAAQLYQEGFCSRGDVLRLSAFCNNCGPAFLLSVAGVGVFGSQGAGFLLLGTHLAASLLVGVLFRFFPLAQEGQREGKPTKPPPDAPGFTAAFPGCVRDSFLSCLNVCAFVVLFTVLLRLLIHCGLLPKLSAIFSGLLPEVFTPGLCQSFLAGFLELSTGVYSLSESASSPLALPLAAFILGWGGLSVHCQSLPFLQGCVSSLKPYFCGKLAQGVLAGLLTWALATLLPAVPQAAPLTAAAGFFSSPMGALLGQEILALWILAGLFLLFTKKKTGKSPPFPLYYKK